MKMPVHCPFCNGPLLNLFKEYPPGKSYAVDKSCTTRLDHTFYCASKRGNEDFVSFISISLDTYRKVSINWNINANLFYIKGRHNSIIPNVPNDIITYLPYIEPDFSDCPKLIKKIKTYINFS